MLRFAGQCTWAVGRVGVGVYPLGMDPNGTVVYCMMLLKPCRTLPLPAIRCLPLRALYYRRQRHSSAFWVLFLRWLARNLENSMPFNGDGLSVVVDTVPRCTD